MRGCDRWERQQQQIMRQRHSSSSISPSQYKLEYICSRHFQYLHMFTTFNSF